MELKTGRLRKPAIASVWAIISSLLARGIGAVGTPIFTRLLTPSEYGLYPLYSSWLGVVSAVATLGLAGGAIYRGLQRYEERRGEFISSALGLFFTLFLPISGAIMLLAVYTEGVTGLSPTVAGMLLSEVLFSTVIAFATARARYEYRYKSLAVTTIVSALFSPVIAVLFITLTPYRAEARILGSLLSALLVALPQLYIMLSRSEKLYDKEIWRYLLRTATPLLPHALSLTLIVRSPEMIIASAWGDTALGKYSVAMSVGLALTVLSGGIGQALTPWLLRKLGRKEHEKIRETVALSAKVMMLGAMLLLAVAPEVMAILAPPEYRDAIGAVYPLALGSVAQFIGNAVMSAESYFERSARASLPTVVTAAVTIGIGVIILPITDYRVAGVLTLGAYLLWLALSLMSYRIMSGERLVDGRVIAGLFLVGGGFASLVFIFRDVWLSRLLLAIALIPVALLYLPRVWRMIKDV